MAPDFINTNKVSKKLTLTGSKVRVSDAHKKKKSDLPEY